MATFKQPMRKGVAAAPTQSQSENLEADLGLDDLDLSDANNSSDESDQSDGEDSKQNGSHNFIEFLGLQRALRDASQQKIKLSSELKKLKADYRTCERKLGQAQQQIKLQRVVMEDAQKGQLKDKDALIDNLTVAVNELKEQSDKAEGISQMVTQLQTLIDEKREAVEEAGILRAELTGSKEEVAEVEQELGSRIKELEEELKVAQDQIDPVKNAKANASAPQIDTEEVDRLREEATELRSQLREAQDSQQSSGGTVSAEAAARFEKKVKDEKRRADGLEQQLSDARAQLAKVQAMSSSGAEAGAQQQELMNELQQALDAEKSKNRDAQAKSSDLASQLEDASAKASQLESELNQLKASLDAQSKEMASSASDIEGQLASRSQELAAERAALSSEKTAHAKTKDLLDQARSEVAKIKEEVDSVSSSSEASLRAEREKHAGLIQKVQAEKAAEIAEVEQRAEDRMKDLKSKLGTMGSQLGPMFKAMKFISSQYKELRKQTRDLQGEIAPSIKQCKRDLLRTLADIDAQYKEMLKKYRNEMKLRKKLHNELVDLKGNIRVFARVRPIIREDGSGPDAKIVTSADPADDQMVKCQRKGKATTFEMDYVFSNKSTQEEVFDKASDVIVSCIDGYNVCIFAYGQTGSGKTFTMDGPDDNPGLNRRALSHLFEVTAAKSGDWTFEIEVSILEIYNETINDLLSEKRTKGGLDIRHGKDGPQVPGLTKHTVSTADEVRAMFHKSQKARKTSSTDMNEYSSRSHALLIIYVSGTNLSTGVTTKGKLNLIDLAGSERPAKSGAIDDPARMKEATNINKSLSCLGDVIHALGAKQKHVPYRNSKLTHLLQDSLGGSAKTVMVVQVSPVLKNVDESSNSLTFAKRVRAVELGAAKKTKESAEVAALKKRIRELEG